MQGIGTVAIDGPRFETFLRSRKGGSRKRVSQEGLARILLLGCTAGLMDVCRNRGMDRTAVIRTSGKWCFVRS